jgi:hypothetical protein
MYRQRLDSVREEPKELGTPISSFWIVGHRTLRDNRYSVAPDP